MRIFKNSEQIAEAKLLNKKWQHAVGLMFSKQKNLIFELKIEKKVSLHMFFVFYPIDVVFLDKNKRVIELKENFQPFTFYSAENNAKFILELKQGTIKDCRIRINDRLVF